MNQEHEIVLYQVEDTNIYVNVMFKEDTFWMTQKAMADLFECTTDNISLHLKNIYKEEELDENRTTEFFSVVQNEGQRNVKRKVKCYNLDAIIAVGYRVNSKKATRFRQWATKTLKEYITKGFVLNDDMLKNGRPFGKDYFDELLERIREIRASERRAYQNAWLKERLKGFICYVSSELVVYDKITGLPRLFNHRTDDIHKANIRTNPQPFVGSARYGLKPL